MGSSTSTVERWRTFREGAGIAGAPDRLCLDENRTHLGRLDPADRRNVRHSSTEALARQRALLAKLIGGEIGSAKSISASLLSAFGSIGSVLNAPPSALFRYIDDPSLVRRLAATRSVVLEGLCETVQRTRFELGDLDLQQWIIGLFKGLRRERIHLALLDRDKRLIFEEPLAEGDLSCVTGNLRKIVGVGIDIDAAGVVLMHNHLSGNAHPSAADIGETRRIAFLLENIDLHLEDHLVISGNTIFSMRGAKLL